jgi:undecaprenyl diphosphate synthase
MSTKAPASVGIIIDGNRRWARAHNLPSFEGHRRGLALVKDVADWAEERGVKELTIYAFSTENWNRSTEEIDYLMRLFRSTIKKELAEIIKRGGRVHFIGQRERLPKSLQTAMGEAEEASKKNRGLYLQIGISYGGRAEIIQAVNTLLAKGTRSVDEKEFREAMWSAGMKDPDLIIRTSGEKRLSNFLLFQGAYSELFFTDTKWPDFSKEEFLSILKEFGERERRHGK